MNFYIHRIKVGLLTFIVDWDNCIKGIKADDDRFSWLIKLLNNKFVGPAHKSDALRYYYLYKQGGVWIDISTFLVSPLDDLVKNNNNGFTCYYMSSNVCSSWLIKLSSDIFEYITMKTYITKFVPEQEKLIKIKNKNFDFITENYFMISSKENDICKDVFEQLKTFWESALDNINSEESNCDELNQLIFTLFEKVYDMDLDKITYLNLVKTQDINPAKKIILKQYFDCGYFFNYLQLYLAILNYSTKNDGKLNNIIDSDKKKIQ